MKRGVSSTIVVLLLCHFLSACRDVGKIDIVDSSVWTPAFVFDADVVIYMVAVVRRDQERGWLYDEPEWRISVGDKEEAKVLQRIVYGEVPAAYLEIAPAKRLEYEIEYEVIVTGKVAGGGQRFKFDSDGSVVLIPRS